MAKQTYDNQSNVLNKEISMDELKELTGKQLPHAHSDGRRCCGRPLAEKCSPEEEAAKIDKGAGEKSCCKGRGHKH
jgi:hypothetical protein